MPAVRARAETLVHFGRHRSAKGAIPDAARAFSNSRDLDPVAATEPRSATNRDSVWVAVVARPGEAPMPPLVMTLQASRNPLQRHRTDQPQPPEVGSVLR